MNNLAASSRVSIKPLSPLIPPQAGERNGEAVSKGERKKRPQGAERGG